MLQRAVIRWVINSAALWLADKLFQGIWFESSESLLVAAIVFGLLNTFIKPILILFTLPINILSLGLFTFVINAFILALTAFWLDSFHLSGFMVALLAAIVISIVSLILNILLKDTKREY
jgi:putative membrane protein